MTDHPADKERRWRMVENGVYLSPADMTLPSHRERAFWVIPASSVADLEAEVERLREALRGIVLHGDIPAGEPWSEAYWEVVHMARAALHPTEENE